MNKKGIGLLAITCFVFFTFLSSYSKMQDMKQKNQDYEDQIQQLKERNAQLVEERRLLEDDPIYLEKVAREKMGIVREGEIIYRIMPMNEEDRE